MSDGEWQRCIGMNRDGRCVSPPGKHTDHRYSRLSGKWYGKLPERKATPPKGVVPPKEKGWWR